VSDCDCIRKANEALLPQGLCLKQHLTVSLETGETGTDLAIETVSLKRGVKAGKIFPLFCPFCGKPTKK